MARLWKTRLCLLSVLALLVAGGGCGRRVQRSCGDNLDAIMLAIHAYAADHEQSAPPNLQVLFDEGYVRDLAVFVCPSAGKAAGEEHLIATKRIFPQPVSSQRSQRDGKRGGWNGQQDGVAQIETKIADFGIEHRQEIVQIRIWGKRPISAFYHIGH